MCLLDNLYPQSNELKKTCLNLMIAHGQWYISWK